jgi:hypothetical protein
MKIQHKFSYFYLLLSFLMNSIPIPLICSTYCHSSFLSSSQLFCVKPVQVHIAKDRHVRNSNVIISRAIYCVISKCSPKSTARRRTCKHGFLCSDTNFHVGEYEGYSLLVCNAV